jgi:predicted pyridoxine 5'-phosphate oxidase superfamily flavin-nucleotide-binding protein
MTMFAYTDKALELQKRFDTEALAAAELQVIVHEALSPADRAFISQMEMFWLASVDPHGSPTVSFKGGAPGFVKMPDDRTLLFPCFDGNGMFFGGLISMDQWGEMVMQGDPLA